MSELSVYNCVLFQFRSPAEETVGVNQFSIEISNESLFLAYKPRLKLRPKPKLIKNFQKNNFFFEILFSSYYHRYELRKSLESVCGIRYEKFFLGEKGPPYGGGVPTE
jgi:hypothetical protein